jgi:hypothetical protein
MDGDGGTTELDDRLGMTEAQWARFQAYTHGFGEQDENGVDVSLLRENLRRTATQRLRSQLTVAEPRAGYSSLRDEEVRAILVALTNAQVCFVLVGGLAMIAHGSAYITRDVDVSYSREPANLGALAAALAPFHPRLRGAPEGLPFRWDALTLRSGMNFTLVTDPLDLDLLGHLAGVESFGGLWERSVEMELYGVPVRVASLDDLIAMKRAAGRAKDQAHLLELERLRILLGDETQE